MAQWDHLYKPWTWGEHLEDGANNLLGGGDNKRTTEAARDIRDEAGKASSFGTVGEQNYGALGAEAGALRGQLRDQASGKLSMSKEQLRQGLQQNLSAQSAMAAGARPGSAPMAARTAMMNAGRMGAGMSGQAAMAGIAERQAAQNSLGGLLMSQRDQDLRAALGGRGLALQGYGNNLQAQAGLDAQPGGTEKLAAAALPFILASDQRAKTGIGSGDAKAQELMDRLSAHTYQYKDPARHGQGPQLGVMAQDMERSGLGKQAVVETPHGKAVDPGKLTGALAAGVALLNKRMAALEESKQQPAKRVGGLTAANDRYKGPY